MYHRPSNGDDDYFKIWSSSANKIRWDFCCEHLLIQVQWGGHFKGKLWLNHDNSCIEWDATNMRDPNIKSLYPKFEAVLQPILDVYPALMEALSKYL
jgi:hypothetical protein